MTFGSSIGGRNDKLRQNGFCRKVVVRYLVSSGRDYMRDVSFCTRLKLKNAQKYTKRLYESELPPTSERLRSIKQ